MWTWNFWWRKYMQPNWLALDEHIYHSYLFSFWFDFQYLSHLACGNNKKKPFLSLQHSLDIWLVKLASLWLFATGIKPFPEFWNLRRKEKFQWLCSWLFRLIQIQDNSNRHFQFQVQGSRHKRIEKNSLNMDVVPLYLDNIRNKTELCTFKKRAYNLNLILNWWYTVIIGDLWT